VINSYIITQSDNMTGLLRSQVGQILKFFSHVRRALLQKPSTYPLTFHCCGLITLRACCRAAQIDERNLR
jgi:hypothetical protein